MSVIQVTPAILLDENDLQFSAVQASGPGGQNVNKVASAIQLRFDAAGSLSLPEDVRQRLLRLAGKRLTQDGLIVIDARRYRTQAENRQDALERLLELLRTASRKPKIRHATRPSKAARQRRLDSKRRRSEVKRTRRQNYDS